MKSDDRTDPVGARIRALLDGWRHQVSARGTSLRGELAPLLGRARQTLRARPGVRRLALGAAALLAALFAVVVVSSPAQADACSPMANPVACENTKPGTDPSVWDITGAGDSTIQGFATDISVNAGNTVQFKINTTASSYKIDIYRLGWYNGLGARKITSVAPSASLPQKQPACIFDSSTEITDCGNWAVSASWAVPSSAVSGIYFALLTRTDTGGTSHVDFVVRNDASTSDVFFQTSDTTWQAYNLYGGSDFYHGINNGRAFKISYNRPFITRDTNDRDWLFSNEVPMLRFLERNGYDVSYTTGVDSDRRGNLIKNHRIFLSVGHDEYWSGAQRANVESARDSGVNLAFFSGNEVYWRTRWENSEDGSNTPYRTLVSYKETWNDAKIDPSPEWTGTYRDPRFTPPAIGGGQPENALTGTLYMSNSDDLAMQVPSDQGKLRFWRGTTLNQIPAGQSVTLAPHTIGYESDEDLDNGFRPAGLIDLSTTTGSTPEYLRDFGSTVTPGTTTHHMTMYKASSGALVFSAGSIQYAWALDDYHDGTATTPDSRMQQAVINLFADMGAQPATLMSGLTAASASTDTTPPTVTITSPAAGTSVRNGSLVTLTGTAADAAPGVVAGVEVSTDGGVSWHPATGTTSWSYGFYAHGLSTQAVQVRAVDDSANKGVAATTSFNLTGASSIFGDRVPVTSSTSDTSAVELGVKFKTDADGVVTGVRFYKGTGNTGTHTGSLWTASGTLLATGTFTGESASGWQTLTFSNQIPVTAGVTYIASYFAPSGHYAGDQWTMSTLDFVNSPLIAPRGPGNGGNGVYNGGAGFPGNTYHDTNYFVDVNFIPLAGAAPIVLAVTPLVDATDVPVTTTASAVFSKDINPATISFTVAPVGGSSVAGTVAYDSGTKTATFTPSAALAPETTFQATVSASDTLGNPMISPRSWLFSTQLDPSVLKLFNDGSVPAKTSVNDSGAVELGVKFTSAVDGQVVGVRFYQGAGNTGTHTGSLWSSTGTRLAQVTFTSGTATGWQTARFATPVTITAGTQYVASYYAPNGHYAADGAFFSSPYVNGSLSAPGGANGVYQYGSTSAFPVNDYNSTNYWVEPMVIATSSGSTTPPPTVTGVSIFTASDVPANADWNDNSAIELGVRFSSDTNGTIAGVRFYKGPTNGGVHTGSLWTAGGQLLATATFSGETASGWQTVYFSSPVAITAGTSYVASYHASMGQYAATLNMFSAPLDRPPLHVPVGGGSYMYGGGGVFPSNFGDNNYWVDVIFVTA